MANTRSMGSNLRKRKAYDELVPQPPVKRLAKKNGGLTQQPPKPKLPSSPRQARKQPIHQPSPTPATSPSTCDSLVKSDTENADAYDADIEDEDEDAEDKENDGLDADENTAEVDHLLDRIRSGIAYTQQQQTLGKPIMQTTRFQIDTTSVSSHDTLTLVRHHATLIASAPRFELFELGIPRPDWVTEGKLPGLHDPQWWVGKSLAEIKAGPHAEEADVRRAAAHLKGLQTRRSKKKGLTAREKEIEWKLNAATKSRKKKLRIWREDEGDGETESEVDGEMYVPSS